MHDDKEKNSKTCVSSQVTRFNSILFYRKIVNKLFIPPTIISKKNYGHSK